MSDCSSVCVDSRHGRLLRKENGVVCGFFAGHARFLSTVVLLILWCSFSSGILLNRNTFEVYSMPDGWIRFVPSCLSSQWRTQTVPSTQTHTRTHTNDVVRPLLLLVVMGCLCLMVLAIHNGQIWTVYPYSVGGLLYLQDLGEIAL